MTDDHSATDPQAITRRVSFGMAYTHVMYREDLAPLTRYLYAVLTTYADRGREAWPSLARIATDSGLGLSTVKRGLKDLEEAGVIIRTHRKSESGADRSARVELVDVVRGPATRPGNRGVHTEPPVGVHTGPHNKDQENRTAPAHGIASSSLCRSCRTVYVTDYPHSCEDVARIRRNAPAITAAGRDAIRRAIGGTA